MKAAILGLAMLPGAANAWERLDNAGILAALNDRTLGFDAYTFQNFRADGSTDFIIAEGASTGRWRASDDQYCSAWPPSDTWTCYDIDAQDDAVRFIARDGSTSVGRYRE